MCELISDGYLNEERFAKNYARGKFRIKGWGKYRIGQELKARHISEYLIKKAMQEVDEEGGYEDTLRSHLEKYMNQRKHKVEHQVLRRKTYAHGISKGFEASLVSTVITDLFKPTGQ